MTDDYELIDSGDGRTKDPADGRLKKNGCPFAFTFLSRGTTEDKFLALFDQALKA